MYYKESLELSQVVNCYRQLGDEISFIILRQYFAGQVLSNELIYNKTGLNKNLLNKHLRIFTDSFINTCVVKLQKKDKPYTISQIKNDIELYKSRAIIYTFCKLSKELCNIIFRSCEAPILIIGASYIIFSWFQ